MQVDGPPHEDASGHLTMADRREIEKRGVGQWNRLASEEGKEDRKAELPEETRG